MSLKLRKRVKNCLAWGEWHATILSILILNVSFWIKWDFRLSCGSTMQLMALPDAGSYRDPSETSDLFGLEWSGSEGKSTPSTKITIWRWERCGALVSIYGTCTKLGCLRPDYADTLPRALSQCSGKILSRAPSSRIPKSVQLGHHIVDLNGYTALRLLLFRIDLIQYIAAHQTSPSNVGHRVMTVHLVMTEI